MATLDRSELLEKIEDMQTALVARATGHLAVGIDYRSLRSELMDDPLVASRLPEFVRKYRTLDQFWPFIQAAYPSYAQRKQFIWDSFRPLVDYLEGQGATPVEEHLHQELAEFAPEHLQALWQKALERAEPDPEGAITAARTLLESVCKWILDEANTEYGASPELPKLYSMTAAFLRLSPSQHSEQIFKQILGGCQSVVEGLGALRNRHGDSHGQGKRHVRPDRRHAELAVNLAGAMASFLIATWRARKEAAA